MARRSCICFSSRVSDTFRSGDERRTSRLPVVRIARIRRAGTGVVERIEVALSFCIGSFKTRARVNLANRRNMRYALLVGRRLMRGRILVDSAQRFLVKPQCE